MTLPLYGRKSYVVVPARSSPILSCFNMHPGPRTWSGLVQVDSHNSEASGLASTITWIMIPHMFFGTDKEIWSWNSLWTTAEEARSSIHPSQLTIGTWEVCPCTKLRLVMTLLVLLHRQLTGYRAGEKKRLSQCKGRTWQVLVVVSRVTGHSYDDVESGCCNVGEKWK